MELITSIWTDSSGQASKLFLVKEEQFTLEFQNRLQIDFKSINVIIVYYNRRGDISVLGEKTYDFLLKHEEIVRTQNWEKIKIEL